MKNTTKLYAIGSLGFVATCVFNFAALIDGDKSSFTNWYLLWASLIGVATYMLFKEFKPAKAKKGKY